MCLLDTFLIIDLGVSIISSLGVKKLERVSKLIKSKDDNCKWIKYLKQTVQLTRNFIKNRDEFLKNIVI